LGSVAAACETELDGNIPIDSNRIRAKLAEIKNLTEYQTN
jgi:hypothetical protein